jgi:DNA-binding MarR family transcriptional regulator
MDGAVLTYGSSSDEAFEPGHDAPILIIGDSNSARDRAAELIRAARLRIGAAIDVADALERLSMQGQLKAVWCELDREPTAELEIVLDALDELGGDGVPVVVSGAIAHIDLIAGRTRQSPVEMLIDATPAERAATLGLATWSPPPVSAANDSSRDSGSERLRQLSEEVNRIATTLARLSSETTGQQWSDTSRQSGAKAVAGEMDGQLSAETVRAAIRARRLRNKYFEEDLFADPAWDMLLDLMQAELAQHRVPVSSLCAAAAVPATTALRWIKALVERGLFMRRPDAHDGRRIFIELAPQTSAAMRGYLAELGRFVAA